MITVGAIVGVAIVAGVVLYYVKDKVRVLTRTPEDDSTAYMLR